MKKFFVILPIVLALSSLCLTAQEERKSADSEIMDSFLKQEKKKPISMYWIIEFGSSYLTSTNEVKKAKQRNYRQESVALNIYFDIPIGTKRQQDISWGFSVAPGLGLGIPSFNIDKELTRDVDGKLAFIPFTQDYEQSYFGAMFFDIPIDFRYLTKPNAKRVNFSFELGSKCGLNMTTNKGLVLKQNDETIHSITYGVKNFNSFRYGIVGKVGIHKLAATKSNGDLFGMSLHLVGNYFPSQVFQSGHGIKTGYFFLGLGYGFYIGKNFAETLI